MTEPSAIPAVTVADVSARVAAGEAGAGPLIVDVREPGEFADVRVEGAALFPMSTFLARHAELPRDRPLLVMCASGNRSAAATGFLLRNGWSDVANVAGGIIAWQTAGYPVRRGTPSPGEGDL